MRINDKVIRSCVLLGMIALMVILTNTDVFPFASNTYFIYYGRPLLWLEWLSSYISSPAEGSGSS